MENLNDVEFGSNQNAEEAPILVAQRYLNIFRQIHIFNQNMRTKFDDELLALEPNVTDFFKRLPGGRLLVEHIEEVKTERGISFVKTNREDFSDGLSDTPSTNVAPVPTQIAGGNLVMDASFAETLAQSMATAFKQTPGAAPSSGGPTISGDFGQAFELIAEEIRTSRASLLDVLKETRNITDSVIASQISISRILEGILSSRQHEENDATNLNNRIIASQASITKLLEGLYTASIQKNAEISDYLNVDTKLQDFRDNFSQKINEVLSVLAQNAQNKGNFADNVVEVRLTAFKNELSEIRQMLDNYIKKGAVPQQSAANLPDSQNRAMISQSMKQDVRTDDNVHDSDVLLNKKKKKKKKKGNEPLLMAGNAKNIALTSAGTTLDSVALADDDSNIPENEDTNILTDDLDNFSDKTSVQPTVSPVDGIIRNSEYKHEDDFSNVDLSLPPLEDDVDISQQSADVNFAPENQNLSTDLSDLDTLDDLTFEAPEEKHDIIKTDVEQEPEDELSSLATITGDDDFDFTHSDTTDTSSENPSSDEVESLDNFAQGFSLPDEKIKESDSHFSDEDASILDDSGEDTDQFSEAFDETLEHPQQDVLTDTVETADVFDDLNSDDEDNLEDIDTSSKNNPSSDESDLDSFGSLHVGSLDDFANTAPQSSAVIEDENSAPVFEEDEETENSDNNEEDDVETEDDLSLAQNSESQGQSRYSAELDKIRRALTSDNIDISSLDEPIALDDYSDDENVSEEEPAQPSATDDQDWEYEYVEDDGSEDNSTETNNSETPSQEQADNEDWEWEYVDENGQAAPVSGNKDDDGDWEWEYVEDDGSGSDEDNENNIQ